jgi:hypothetical protein
LTRAIQISGLVAQDEAVDADARVVDEHVQGAELRHHLVDGGGAGGSVGDVELDQVQRGGAGGLGGGLGLGRGGVVARVADGDLAATLGQPDHGGPPDAARPAGHQSNLALELLRHRR